MRRKRTHVLLHQEIKRRLLAALSHSDPAWKDADHPELAEGVEAWVRRMRDEDNWIAQEKWDGAGNEPE